MRDKFYTLIKGLRFSNWWNSKVPMYLALFLLAQNAPLLTVDLVVNLSELFAWLIFAASFGHFLNDSFDIEEDKRAQKITYAQSLRPPLRGLMLFTLAVLSLLPWLITGKMVIAGLAAIHLICFCIYSVPPLRLKDRLYLGVFMDTLYAFVLPSAIIMTLTGYALGSIMFAVIVWAFIAGLRAIILHHVGDRKADKGISKGNVVNYYGTRFNLRLFNFFFVPEFLLFLFIYFKNGHLAFTIPAILVYLFFQLIDTNSRGIKITDIPRKIFSGNFRLFEFYERWLLFLVLIYLIPGDWNYVFLLLAFMLCFRLVTYYYIYHYTKVFISTIIHHVILKLFYFFKHIIYHVILLNVFFFFKRLVTNVFYKILTPLYYVTRYRILLPAYFYIRYKVLIPMANFFIFHVVRPPGSLVINYSIYAYRRVVLSLSDAEARALVTRISPFTDFFEKKRAPVPTQKEPVEASRRLNKLHEAQGVQKESEAQAGNLQDVLNEGELTADNMRVNGLWIGTELSKIELLTIKSFLRQGHEFHLWVYGKLKTELPEGVIVEDANEIIHESKIFRYKFPNAYGHGKGSVSGFSDIFRYKLLYEKGGWWVDMDITCLKPLNIITPYFFRQHHDLALVGNLMKCPAGNQLMKRCYEEASVTVDENNRDWHKPIEILNRHVFELGLQKFIFGGLSNEDKWDEVKSYVKGNTAISEDYLVVHWMNEEWRSRGMDKSDFRFRSRLGEEMLRYALISVPEKKSDLFLNEIRHLFWLPMYQIFKT